MKVPLGRLSRPPRPIQVVGGYPPFAVMASLLGGHDVSVSPSLQLSPRLHGDLVTWTLHEVVSASRSEARPARL